MKARRSLALALTALIFAPLLALAAPGTAAPPGGTGQRIDTILKTLGKTRKFSSVAMSPDGKTLAWSVREAGGKSSLVQLANANGGDVRDVAMPGDGKTPCDASELSFSPDGRKLAVLSNCGGKDGRLDGKQRNILLIDVRAAHPKAHQVSRLEGHVHDVTWAPNGRTLGILYVISDTHDPEAHAPIKPRVGVIGDDNVEHQRFGTINAVSGELRLVTPPDVFVYDYGWAPDSRGITFVGAPPPGRDNWWVAKLYAQRFNGQPRVLLDPSTTAGSLHGLQIALPRFSPDGKQIALIGGLMSDQGVTGGDIYLVPAKGGPARDITPGIGISPSWLAWSGRHRLLVSAIAGGSTAIVSMRVHAKQPATATTLLTVHASVTNGSAMSSLALDAGRRRLAFIHSTFTQPPEIYSGVLPSGSGPAPANPAAPRAVTHVNDGLTPIWGQQRSITWTNEGFTIQGWLLLPAHYDPSRTYPMVVQVHGGPASAVRPSWGSSRAVSLSAMGYFVLMPNPRGSYGQGETFTQANRRDFGHGDMRDMLAGIDAVEKQYPVDDTRLGLVGGSYGGFMSMFAPTQTKRFAAAVAVAGVANWQSYYGQNSIDQWMIPFFGASVYDDPAVYARSSAINFIKHDKTPTLVMVGQYDGETPAAQSIEFWHALKTLGVPTQLVIYPGEGHGFRDPTHRRDAIKRTLSWFHTYLVERHRSAPPTTSGKHPRGAKGAPAGKP